MHTAVGLQEDFMDFVLSKVASMGVLAFGVGLFATVPLAVCIGASAYLQLGQAS